MSVTIETCTDIAATPDEVWAVVEQIHTHARWMADAERITFVGPQMQGVGAEFDCLTGRGRFTLTATDGGTHFCWHEVLTFPWWMGGRLGERVAKPVFERVWRENLARLRSFVADGLSGR